MAVLTDTLVEAVAGSITRYSMTKPGDRLGVAVSGGVDSVVLLNTLHRLAERLQITLMVLHLNHQLRGAESDGDEDFVRALADSLGHPALVERTSLPVGGNLEQSARLARRDFYCRVMHESGLTRVALGHTRSDQAETVLLRFLRGSGTAGLAGMRPVTGDNLIRPLLMKTRDEVRAWAVAEGICWREDSSNANLQFKRNRLRHKVVPVLTRDFNPNLEAVLAGMAEVAQAEEDYWSQQMEHTCADVAQRTRFGLVVEVKKLTGLQLAIQRRVIRRSLSDLRGDLRSVDLQHIDAILALCRSTESHDRVIVPGVDALRSYGKLLLTAAKPANLGDRQYKVDLRIGQECELPFGAGRIFLETQSPGQPFCANFKKEADLLVESAELDGDALAQLGAQHPIYVRNWEPGDTLQRPEHAKPEKIKSLFQEHRVLLWERRHWPVVVSGGEIVWARKFGASAHCKGSAASRKVLRLTYKANS